MTLPSARPANVDIKLSQTTRPAPPVFADVKEGQVFMGRATRVVYVKIRAVLTSANGIRNAVRLDDGSSFHFTDGTEIHVPKQAQLRVEE